MTTTSKKVHNPLHDRLAINEALGLFVPSGQVTELRVLEGITRDSRWPQTFSGYFDDPAKLADAVATIKSAKGIYFIPNPVVLTLIARANNRIRPAAKGESTQDTHIVRRHWLLIDVDAQRPSGISSSDDEHSAAIERAHEILRFLKQQGWPDPILADSGNGAHLLYRIDLPTEDDGLVQRCLCALAARFDDDQVRIDQSVFNPARIWKLYGTLACKGDSTDDRPHRMAVIISKPEMLEVVAECLLEALATEVPECGSQGDRPEYHGHGDQFDLEDFVRRHAFDVRGPEDWNGRQGAGRRWIFNTSPLCEHNDGAAFLLQHARGAITAGCHHDSCKWNWQTLRQRYESGGSANGVPRVVRSNCDALLVDDPWPNPIDPAAYHGLAGRIVETIEPHSEADPVALLVQVLVAFGNIVGRCAHFTAEADKHFANLFCCLVGRTSKGRKGSSWGHVGALFGSVDPDWRSDRVLGGLSSGEGLIWSVRDPITKREAIREGTGRNRRIVDYEEVVADPGVADKRLLILEPEFGSVLKVIGRERNTLSAIIRQAWDTGTLRTMTKNTPATATGAHVSIIGHITRDELRRQITETDMANGLANRFLWLCVERSKHLPEGGAMHEVNTVALVSELLEAVTFARTIGEVRRDEDARAIWCEIYPELSAGRPGLLGAATSRAEAQVMRLGMDYALLDRSTVIRAEHLLAAVALWTYADESARYIFGSALGDPTADEILRVLRASAGGMTRNDIRQHFGRHKKSEELGRALSVLLEYRLIRVEIEKTKGRPAQRFHACP